MHQPAPYPALDAACLHAGKPFLNNSAKTWTNHQPASVPAILKSLNIKHHNLYKTGLNPAN
ncbi:hypothetical protein CDQ84_00930 [Clostridium thermosuccinogenes]|uniref:Uncharacterized protein n=1 Tax=Clostridium thermosuccinogenes TaxID=84032 RepID=A0A2K2F658_9CLOT|nr:hypothetical protein CDO33_16920 [Pseudoclostridium thermosuccinogenes]PNT94273.1 hypothetical protein CDQ83_12580 [Pseudoclostridium thermosuccinogenes]PNU00279.1 hypothetical protein CDQ85_00930 [Pseudoclostridium thermosuccinogenes]PNU01603.1 hypothetical protein CDQ84_00930 [Pseudoclostridium thermosuccinogenes]